MVASLLAQKRIVRVIIIGIVTVIVIVIVTVKVKIYSEGNSHNYVVKRLKA